MGCRVTDLSGFTERGREAMQKSPDYFLWWYSLKSWLLVGAVAALAYTTGKNAPRKE